jgi:hypothetical protein
MLKRDSFPIDRIYVPVKRRATLKPEVVREIAESMLEKGQESPILVRPDGDRFVLVEGLHRLEACRALGEDTIAGFLVSAQSGSHEKASSPYEAEAEAAREKTERLRKLRLAKEAEESAATNSAGSIAPTASPKETTKTTGSERPSRSCRVAKSKPVMLSEWLAARERDGFRS